MHVKFVNGRETVSAQCLETFADAGEAVSRQFWRANRMHFTRPPRACQRVTFVNTAEIVRRQCLARTNAGGFFSTPC